MIYIWTQFHLSLHLNHPHPQYFPVKCHLQNFQQDICSETTYLDSILHRLHQYYADIKTQHQLNYEVPAGFKKLTQHQMDYNVHTSNLLQTSPDESTLDDHTTALDPVATSIPSTSDTDTATTSTNPSPSIIGTPTICLVDKPSLPLPHTIMMSEDFLHACVGFQRINTVKQHMNTLYSDTIKLSSIPADAVLDQGDLSMIQKSARNTAPVPWPNYFGEVMHMDIVFGPEISVGNIHYSLYLPINTVG
jgi:hypothetical protein